MASAFLDQIEDRARRYNKKIVLPEGNDERVLQGAREIIEKQLASVVILGDVDRISSAISDMGADPSGSKIEIINPESSKYIQQFTECFYELRKHKGITLERASQIVLDDVYFGTMMVKCGYADGLIAGACHSTADTIRPALQIIKTASGVTTISSMFFMCKEQQTLLFADCGIIQSPDARQLCDIAVGTTKTAFLFGINPRIAMLSYSSKGSSKGEGSSKVARATERAKEIIFSLFGANVIIDGELQFDAAYVPQVAAKKAPGSPLKGNANTFIFPDLGAGNICYKAVQRLAGMEAYGPVLQGLARPVNDLSRGCSVEDVVATAAITAIQAAEF